MCPMIASSMLSTILNFSADEQIDYASNTWRVNTQFLWKFKRQRSAFLNMLFYSNNNLSDFFPLAQESCVISLVPEKKVETKYFSNASWTKCLWFRGFQIEVFFPVHVETKALPSKVAFKVEMQI